jgi:hypothetical protein
MKWIVALGAVIVVSLGALVVYMLVTGQDPQASMKSGLRSVEHAVTPHAPADAKAEPLPPAPDVPSDGRRFKPAVLSNVPATVSRPQPAPMTSTVVPSPPTVAAPATAPKAAAAVPAAVSSGPPPAFAKIDRFLPANTLAWANEQIPVTGAVIIRAAGQTTVQDEPSGPEGLNGSTYERTLERRNKGRSARVMPSAPYLALLGRVCSNEECSSPFVIGSSAIVCPADMPDGGALQLWTNNYVQLEGRQTMEAFAGSTGGYSFHIEPGAAESCSARVHPGPSLDDVKVLGSGQPLRKAEFSISSAQSYWKPFFLPLDQPLTIRASGQFLPGGSARPTGPDGIAVPDAPFWSYPGAAGLVVDSDHQLIFKAFPFQSLIGRLCSSSACDEPFLVGHEKTICANPKFNDHLELWVNRIVGPPGMLGNLTTLVFETLDAQARRGTFKFEVSKGQGCGG